MERPDFITAVIDLRKLTDYLLAVDHLEGAAKAAFFAHCGFSVDRPSTLADALRMQAAAGAHASVESGFGLKYIVDGLLIGLDGRARRIRTVWIIESGSEQLRFVTAYPLEARRGAR